ncbi:hypothetical protein ACEXQD_06875 [Herbiconiux sp. P15]|uniref:hypothetical protein n=1 Tax=Herbiconiux liukaitaii TaxID=3342799 RepID=UPI0035B74072
MDGTQAPPRFARYVWDFALVSCWAAIGVLASSLSAEDWKWLGFVLPVAVVFGLAGWLGGFALAVATHWLATKVAERTADPRSRRARSTVVAAGTTAAAATLVSLFAERAMGAPTWLLIALPLALAALSALLWKTDPE